MSEVTVEPVTRPPFGEGAQRITCGRATVLVFSSRYQVELGTVGTPDQIFELLAAVNAAIEIMKGGSTK